MKPFYKSVSVALAFNFGEAQGADETITPPPEEIDDRPIVVSPPANTQTAASSAANAVELSPFDDCFRRLAKIVDDSLVLKVSVLPSYPPSYPLFRSSAFSALSFAYTFSKAPLLQPVRSNLVENIHGWLSTANSVISPVEVFQIIDTLPGDAIKIQINGMAIKFFGNLLKSNFWTLSPVAEFPYRLIDLKGDETFSFVVRSSPLDGTDALYNTFASSLYEQLISGTNDLKVLDIFNASPAPKDSIVGHAIAITPQLLRIFAGYHRALTNLRSKTIAVVDSRFAFMRAVAHSLFDFTRADSTYVGRLLTSASHLVTRTSLVENVSISLNGELRALSNAVVDESTLREIPAYIEVRDATKVFLNQLLALWSRPFMEDVKQSERITVIRTDP